MENTIKNSWPLVAFAKIKGAMSVGKATNKETGETFDTCAFKDANGGVCFVNFSSKLGPMTAQEIAAQKSDLQVVELESGTFKLCKNGSDSWQTVDLF